MDSTYDVSIPGNVTLDKFKLLIQAQENTGAEFVKSVIVSDGDAKVNQVTLRNLPAGTVPDTSLVWLPGTAPASDNATPAWTGQLLLQSGAVTVSVFRT